MKAKLSFYVCVLCASALAVGAQFPSASFVPGTAADEAAIRAIVASQSADKEDPHVASDLDWENAFGIRYTNLQKRNHFFNTYVKSQFKDATNDSLEVKVRFLDNTVAIADEYWHVAGQVYAGDSKPGPDRWGRTTYVFKKENGAWTEVLERVADLRSAYFKHYDAMPAPVHVDAAVLASYTGRYMTAQGQPACEVSVNGDRLTITNRGRAFAGIPTSATDFLAFDPDDMAEYLRVSFHPVPASSGKPAILVLTLSRADGELLATASKTP